MGRRSIPIIGCLVLSLLLHSQSVDDPVVKAKTRRGVSEDLPEVPRTIIEPPPLPPPETHLKDTKGYKARVSKKSRRGKYSKGRGKKSPRVGSAGRRKYRRR